MLGKWLQSSTSIRKWLTSDVHDPYGVAELIADNPSSITIDGLNNRTVSAQTVAIDLATLSASEGLSLGANALNNKQRMTVLGYKGHPEITDTDLQYGDEFSHAGQRYRVVKVETHFTDRIIGIAEAVE